MMERKSSEDCADERARGLRILFLSDKIPSTNAGGASAYAYDIVTSLGELGDVDCLVLRGLASRMAWRVASPPREHFVEVHPRFVRRGNQLYSVGNAVRRILKGRPRLQDFPRRPEDRSICHELDHLYVRELAEQQHYDIVVANYFWKAELLQYFPNASCLVLAHDVFHQHVDATKAERWQNGQPITPEVERDALNRADLVIAISGSDAECFEQIGVTSEKLVAPMSARSSPRPPSGGGSARLLFVGSRYAPNVEGIEWFCREVFPRVRREVPEAVIEVVGTVCRGLGDLACDGLELTGFVDDLSDAYARADAAVIPILSGTGMKIKLVEAVDHEVPFVSTAAGMRGVEEVAESFGFAPCDDPGDFAAACVRLLGDPECRHRGEAAVATMKQRHFSPQAVHAELREWLARNAGAGIAMTPSATAVSSEVVGSHG